MNIYRSKQRIIINYISYIRINHIEFKQTSFNQLNLNIFKNKKNFPYKVRDTFGGGQIFFSFNSTFTLEGGGGGKNKSDSNCHFSLNGFP